MTPVGLPHSDTSGSMPACGSPEHFAAFHVLLRLSAPRHPPYALINLTYTVVDKLRLALSDCISASSVYSSTLPVPQFVFLAMLASHQPWSASLAFVWLAPDEAFVSLRLSLAFVWLAPDVLSSALRLLSFLMGYHHFVDAFTNASMQFSRNSRLALAFGFSLATLALDLC